MAIFETDTTKRFYRVLESEAGAYRGEGLQLGQILMTVGPELLDMRDRVAAGRLERMPDPGPLLPWFSERLREVSAETFSIQRSEPPAEVFLTEDEVLRRQGWASREDLAHAQGVLKFPSYARHRPEYIEGQGVVSKDQKWMLSQILNWERSQDATKRLFAGAGR